jgi:hypothetical protein
MHTMRFPDGAVAVVRVTAMHRRKPYSKRPYARPTDWAAQAGQSEVYWGHTRREALDKLRAAVQGTHGLRLVS